MSFSYNLNLLAIQQQEFDDIFSDEFLRNVVKRSLHVELKYKQILNMFYSKKIKQPNQVGYLSCFPEAGESNRNYRYRFIILKLKDDFILCYFKYNEDRRRFRSEELKKTRRPFIQFYHPISYNENIDNEFYVLNRLKSFCSDLRLFTKQDNGKKYIFNNYYNTKKTSEFLFTNKWKTKNYINKFEQIPDITVEFSHNCSEKTLNQIIDLITKWESIKLGDDKDHKSDMLYDKRLLQTMNNCSSLSLMTIKIKNHLIAYSLGFEFVNNMFITHSEKHISVFDIEFISKHTETDLKTAKLIKQRLSSFVQFKAHEHYISQCGYNVLFYEGDVRLKNLANYKSMFYKNCVFFYDIPLKEIDVETFTD